MAQHSPILLSTNALDEMLYPLLHTGERAGQDGLAGKPAPGGCAAKPRLRGLGRTFR